MSKEQEEILKKYPNIEAFIQNKTKIHYDYRFILGFYLLFYLLLFLFEHPLFSNISNTEMEALIFAMLLFLLFTGLSDIKIYSRIMHLNNKRFEKWRRCLIYRKDCAKANPKDLTLSPKIYRYIQDYRYKLGFTLGILPLISLILASFVDILSALGCPIIIIFLLVLIETDFNHELWEIKSYIKFCYEKFREEIYKFLAEKHKDYNKFISEIKEDLDNLINLLDLKIFGKNAPYTSYYETFQNEKNLRILLLIIRKLATKIYQFEDKKEELSKKEEGLLGLIGEIEKEIMAKINFSQFQSHQFKNLFWYVVSFASIVSIGLKILNFL